MIILALYYTFADVILLLQCLIYHNRNITSVDPKHLSPATPLLDDLEEYGADYGSNINNRPAPPREMPKWKRALFNTVIVLCVFSSGFLGWYFTPSQFINNSIVYSSLQDIPRRQEIDYWGQVYGWLCAVLYLGSRVPQILLNYTRKSCEGVSFLFFLFACLGNLTFVISIMVKDTSKQYLVINASWLAGSVGTLFLDFIIFLQFWIYNDDEYFYDDDDDDDDDGTEYEDSSDEAPND
jgi:hypothetical protein